MHGLELNDLNDEVSYHQLIIDTLREAIDTSEWLGGKSRTTDLMALHDTLRTHTARLGELNARKAASSPLHA